MCILKYEGTWITKKRSRRENRVSFSSPSRHSPSKSRPRTYPPTQPWINLCRVWTSNFVIFAELASAAVGFPSRFLVALKWKLDASGPPTPSQGDAKRMMVCRISLVAGYEEQEPTMWRILVTFSGNEARVPRGRTKTIIYVYKLMGLLL